MNEQEQKIADFLLISVSKAKKHELQDAVYVYQQFLNTVQTRLQIEAQNIENAKNG